MKQIGIEAPEEAMLKYGQPKVMNADHGGQFASTTFSRFQQKRIEISMDGKRSGA